MGQVFSCCAGGHEREDDRTGPGAHKPPTHPSLGTDPPQTSSKVEDVSAAKAFKEEPINPVNEKAIAAPEPVNKEEPPDFKQSEEVKAATQDLKSALKAAGNALGGLTLATLAKPLAAVFGIADQVERASANVETLRQLSNHVTIISEHALKPLRTLAGDQIPEGMIEDVEAFVKALNDVCLKSEPLAQRAWLERTVTADHDEALFKKFADDVKYAVEAFQLSMMVQGRLHDQRHEKKLETVINQQQTMHEDIVFRDRGRLVEGLPHAVKARYNSDRDKEEYAQCFQGTRTNVIEKIMSWLHAHEDSKKSRLFWLNGLAGIGKTTIARTIAEKADREGILGGSFFFSRNDDKLTDPTLVFPTLAFQLAQLDKSLKSAIGRALEKDANCGYAPALEQLEKLIIEPLCSLYLSESKGDEQTRKRHDHLPGKAHASSSADSRVIVIVIDALDECRNDDKAANIVRLLISQLGSIPFPVRVLLTSRPEPHINAAFQDFFDLTQLVLHVDVESEIVQDDIRHYLRENLKAIPSRLGVRVKTGWPDEADLETLVERSGTLFVYAATAIRFIRNNRARKPVRQLEILLGVQDTKGTQPYSDLDALYLQIITSAFPLGEVNEDDLNTYRWLVGILVLLRNPLSLRALSAFAQVESEDIKNSTLYHLQSIIITPTSENDPPHIFHPSFPDFITSEKRCHSAVYRVHPPSTEQKMVLRCLQLFKGYLRRNILDLGRDQLMNEHIRDLDELVKNALPEEVQYACMYWSSHLVGVAPDDPLLVHELLDFMSTSLLLWFEAMSLLGQTSRAISAMRAAHLWAETTSNENLKTLMYDGYRFALSHQDTIEHGALQVYYAALPFTPRETMLYLNYEEANRDLPSIRVVAGLPNRWSPCLSSVRGGQGGSLHVAYSHDGKHFALDFFDRPWFSVREASSGADLSTLQLSNPHNVSSLAFLQDGQLLVGASTGPIFQWNILIGKEVGRYEGHSSSVTGVSVCRGKPGHFASGSTDTTLRIWDVLKRQCVCTLECDSSPVHAIAFIPDGTRLLAGCADGFVRIWDVSILEVCSRLTAVSAHTDCISTLSVSPDGHSYCTGSLDTEVKVFCINEDTASLRFDAHKEEICCVVYSPDGGTILSAAKDERHIRIWDTSTGKLKGLSRGYVTCVAYSPDGQQVVTASTDGICRLWTGDPSVVIDWDCHSDWVVSVVFSPDGKLIASGGNENDRAVGIWDASTGARRHNLVAHRWGIYALAFSEDGVLLASGSGDTMVNIWNVESGERLFTLDGHDNWICDVDFTSNDGDVIVRTLHTTYTWDIRSGHDSDVRLIDEQLEENKPPESWMVGESEGYVFSMGDYHRLFMGVGDWETANRCMVSAVQEEYRITGFAFHGDRVVFACTDGTVLILDISRLKEWFVDGECDRSETDC